MLNRILIDGRGKVIRESELNASITDTIRVDVLVPIDGLLLNKEVTVTDNNGYVFDCRVTSIGTDFFTIESKSGSIQSIKKVSFSEYEIKSMFEPIVSISKVEMFGQKMQGDTLRFNLWVDLIKPKLVGVYKYTIQWKNSDLPEAFSYVDATVDEYISVEIPNIDTTKPFYFKVCAHYYYKSYETTHYSEPYYFNLSTIEYV